MIQQYFTKSSVKKIGVSVYFKKKAVAVVAEQVNIELECRSWHILTKRLRLHEVTGGGHFSTH